MIIKWLKFLWVMAVLEVVVVLATRAGHNDIAWSMVALAGVAAILYVWEGLKS